MEKPHQKDSGQSMDAGTRLKVLRDTVTIIPLAKSGEIYRKGNGSPIESERLVSSIDGSTSKFTLSRSFM
jgi:hypothetical protein